MLPVDHYIFILSFVLSFFFFPRLMSAVADWMWPYLHTWCGLSANLRCRSETCCTRLAANTGRKKSSKICHHATLLGYILATKARIDNRKNLVKQQYLLSMPHSMVNFGPLAAEIGPVVSGTPAHFNGFRVLAALLQQRRSAEANQTLHGVWPSPGLVHYIYIFGSSCPVT